MSSNFGIERRAGWYDNTDVLAAIHSLASRVVVIETRVTFQEEKLLEIEEEIKEIKTSIKDVLLALKDHAEKEDEKQIKMLTLAATTLLSIIGGGVVLAINYLL